MFTENNANSEESSFDEITENDKFYHAINDVVEDHLLENMFKTDNDENLSEMISKMYHPQEFEFTKDADNVCIMDLLHFINDMIFTPKLADQFFYKIYKFENSDVSDRVRFGYEFFEKHLTDNFYQIEYVTDSKNKNNKDGNIIIQIQKIKRIFPHIDNNYIVKSLNEEYQTKLVYEIEVAYNTQDTKVAYTYEFKETKLINSIKMTNSEVPLMKFTFELEAFLNYIYRVFQIQSAMMFDSDDGDDEDDDGDATITHLGKGTNW